MISLISLGLKYWSIIRLSTAYC